MNERQEFERLDKEFLPIQKDMQHTLERMRHEVDHIKTTIAKKEQENMTRAMELQEKLQNFPESILSTLESVITELRTRQLKRNRNFNEALQGLMQIQDHEDMEIHESCKFSIAYITS